MMSESRPFASLTSGLLARKGFARPAMRPQGHALTPSHDDLGWNDMGSFRAAEEERPQPAVSFLTPLSGGEDAGSPLLEPAPPVVHRQQEVIAQEFGAAIPAPDDAFADEAPAAAVESPVVAEAAPVAAVRAPKASRSKAHGTRVGTRTKAAPGSRAKAAFTLRLDPERHLRLRLACAVGHRSAQRLLINALDAYLADIPGLDALAQNVPGGAPSA